MNTEMSIEERCTCGATFHAIGPESSCLVAASEWREGHRCVPPVVTGTWTPEVGK